RASRIFALASASGLSSVLLSSLMRLILPYPRPAPGLPDGVGPYQRLSTGVPAGHVAQRLGEELGEGPDRVEHEPVVVPGLDDARLHLRPRRLGELRVPAGAPLEAGAAPPGVGAHPPQPTPAA